MSPDWIRCLNSLRIKARIHAPVGRLAGSADASPDRFPDFTNRLLSCHEEYCKGSKSCTSSNSGFRYGETLGADKFIFTVLV
jgi:hypothetical protein